MYLPRCAWSIDFSLMTGRRMISAAVRRGHRVDLLDAGQRRLLDDERVGVEDVDDVERVGQDDRRRSAGCEPRARSRSSTRRRDDEDPAAGLERAEDAAKSRVLIASRPKVSTTLIASSPSFAVSAPRRASALHLARQALLVRARVRPEDHAAAAVVRRARRCPGGRGRCPSGGTASCRRRGPRRGSWCRACRSGGRPAGPSRPGGARRR